MFMSIVPMSANAATTINYAPNPKVEYNYSSTVKIGTIRYISQTNPSTYFNSNYWGSWVGLAGSECGTSSISMSLSYIGINKTPKDILDYSYETAFGNNWGGAQAKSYLYSNIKTAFNNYLNGNGKYSPPIIHLNNYSRDGHYVILIGKVSDNQYKVIDPANTSVWTITINGASAQYNHPSNGNFINDSLDLKYWNGSDRSDDIYQYYNPNASINNDTQKPTISNVKITNITSSGYTVTCTVKDNIGVTRVTFPTWTEHNGQDDLLWKNGTINGNTVTFNVRASDHNNESGYYATHIYAYDAAGNEAVYHCLSTNVPSSHTHSYTSTITRNPTCKTDGIRTYKCSCGDSYTQNIGKHPATHEGGTEIRNARAATCKDTGYTGDTYCKGCGVCIGFGTSTAKNNNNHTGGTTIKNTKNPTCTAEGYTGDTYCKGCNTKLSSGKAIAKIPHAYEEIARVYPNCTKTGLITYACYCGASYDEIIPANGHTETDWIIHKAATCTAAGTQYKECTVCDELLKIEIIPVLPHNYDSVVTKETCTTDGYTTYTCPDCGHTYVGDETKATGHFDSEWIIDIAPTCTAKGYKHIECTVCGETLKTESIAKTPHDYDYVVTNATCETDGYTTVTCPDCGDTYITDEVPAFGHSDEDKDTFCDECDLQLTCEHCGRPVHEGTFNENLCIIIMMIKLLTAFLGMVTA